MIITNYHVHSTLRAYGQQLAEKTRLARAKAPKSTGPKDEVILSQESKKRLTAQKIASQIIRQFSDGQELADTHREVLSRLSREYGQPVKVEKREDQGLVFKVPQGKSSGETRNASAEEAEILNKKLFEITQSVVYNNLG
jgi:queuine/archaeosine tRNA-ribosyltransferase